MPYSHITSRCFVNAPFSYLTAGLLDLFIEHRIQPEIGLEGNVLSANNTDDFKKIAEVFQKAGLACTLHAPFLGLDLGSADMEIRRHSQETLKKAFSLIQVFKPVSIVCHLSETSALDGRNDEGFDSAIRIWKELLAIAEQHNTLMMLENTYETDPGRHKKLFQELNSENARFCLDVGHVMAFAKNRWQDWLPALEPWLGQLHLHDNHGAGDDHLGLGNGTFDFKGLFAYLKKKNLHPIITLEPHQEEGLWESLEYIDRVNLFGDVR